VKVRIEAGALDEALRAVAAAVPRPGTGYAALQGVHLVADGAVVTFQTSNLDLTITHAVPGDVAGAGSVLVPHAVLAAVAGRLRGPVEVTGDSGVVLVRAGNRTAELRPLGDAVWPRFPPLTGDPIILSAADRDTIARLRPFTSADPARPVLGGVRLLDGLAVATDSYRLAAHPVATPVDALLPAGLVAAACRRRPNAGPAACAGPLSLLPGPLAIEARAGATAWRAATVEGEHLPLAAVQALTRWGVADPRSAAVVRADLLDALDLAAVGAELGSEAVRLTIGEGGLEVAATSAPARLRVALDAATTGAVTMGFNGRYLRDLLRACTGDVVTLTMVDEHRPCRVIDGDLTAIVMPVRPAT
jgi:DNA polymerase III sliding clamp (beta) subunit (PCNA family)